MGWIILFKKFKRWSVKNRVSKIALAFLNNFITVLLYKHLNLLLFSVGSWDFNTAENVLLVGLRFFIFFAFGTISQSKFSADYINCRKLPMLSTLVTKLLLIYYQQQGIHKWFRNNFSVLFETIKIFTGTFLSKLCFIK